MYRKTKKERYKISWNHLLPSISFSWCQQLSGKKIKKFVKYFKLFRYHTWVIYTFLKRVEDVVCEKKDMSVDKLFSSADVINISNFKCCNLFTLIVWTYCWKIKPLSPINSKLLLSPFSIFQFSADSLVTSLWYLLCMVQISLLFHLSCGI